MSGHRQRLIEVGSALLTTAFLLLAALACNEGGYRTPNSPADALPHPQHGELGDPGRMSPWQRLAQFEQQFRSGVSSDRCVNYATEYTSRCALTYPKSVRREAAWTYVLIGRDFIAQREWAAAARADWAALGLVRKTVASRPDRERIRAAAYRDLAVIARARAQKEWAELVELPARLIETYLASPQAASDDGDFERVMKNVERAEERERQVQANIEHQRSMMAIQSGLNQMNAQLMAQNNPSAGVNMAFDNLRQTVEGSFSVSNQFAQLREASAESAPFLREYAAVVGDDVTEIDSGKSFVAREVAFFLLSAGDHAAAYRGVIDSWAGSRPALRAKLAANAPPNVLAKDLQLREVHAARYERRGVVPAPSFPEDVGGPAEDGDAGAAGPQLASAYEIVEGIEPGGAPYRGSLEVEPHGAVVHLLWRLSSGVVTGVGIVRDGKLYAGWSTSRDVGVTVYTLQGGKYVGTWATFASGDAMGEEVLDGPATLGGQYKIASGRLPSGGGYGGSVVMAPTRDTFDVRMTVDAEKYRGIGLKTDEVLTVSWAPGEQGAGVTVYTLTPDGMTGVWAAPGGTQLGRETLKRSR